MQIKIADDYKIIAGTTPLVIKPAPIKCVTVEKKRLPPGIPTWRVGAGLAETRLVFRTIIVPSVRVYDRRGMEYKKSKDYRLNGEWGKLTLAPNSRIRQNQDVWVDYRYRLSRIDLIEKNAQGKIRLRSGKPSLECPLLPRVSKGCVPMASIYLAPQTTRITAKNIYQITPHREHKSKNTIYPAAVIARLKAGQPVTIVCCGDSITHYGDASTREKSYFGRLHSFLTQKYPRSKITMINAGVGGNTSDDAIKRFKKDVLAHRPHLVTIMFGVNDENGPPGSWKTAVPLARYRTNILSMIRQLKTVGSQVILMGPTPKNPGWEHTSGHIRDYGAVTERLAREQGIPLANVTKAWFSLKEQGIPYITYLSTCINHPNDHGHRLIFNEVKKLFP